MTQPNGTPLGWWSPVRGASDPESGPAAIEQAIRRLDEPIAIVDSPESAEGIAAARGGATLLGGGAPDPEARRLVAWVPPLAPGQLGDPEFLAAHGVRFAYVAGEMANGIGSVEIVEAMGRAGMLGFFGAAGLSPARVEEAIVRLHASLGELPWGINLIHSPSEPDLEAAVAQLYLRHGVRRVCASAYLDLTLPIVRYRTAGIRRGASGEVVVPNQVFAKVSRVEVARRFLSPPPERFLAALVERGELTAEQARLAETIPMADDLTAEADSGGHTDNRPAITLIPTMIALRDEVQAERRYARTPRIGAAGGIATPASAAAAFAMGASYVLTGSINQACVEAGTSAAVKEMLARSSQADVTMAPAADMFEMGVKVQVLKFGTMFAVRSRKLYDVYRDHPSLEAIPAAVRAGIERDLLKATFEEAWAGTRDFFLGRDPRQVERAERDPKHKMALVFRAYLGLSSRWAITGDASRSADYQVWCGPAMGAFNEWVRGSCLDAPERRRVVPVALNILAGAAVLTRVAALRAQGVRLPAAAQRFVPLAGSELDALLGPARNEQGEPSPATRPGAASASRARAGGEGENREFAPGAAGEGSQSFGEQAPKAAGPHEWSIA